MTELSQKKYTYRLTKEEEQFYDTIIPMTVVLASILVMLVEIIILCR